MVAISGLRLELETQDKDNAETQGAQRFRGEKWDGVNRASWRVTIRDYGSIDIMQSLNGYWISIRMNCGKLCAGVGRLRRN